jgi:DNA-binding CsgD family transcriptional regulator
MTLLSSPNLVSRADAPEGASAGHGGDPYAELLAPAAEGPQGGSWEWDLSTDRVRLSPACRRLFALSPANSEPALDLILGRVHPVDRARFVAEANQVRQGGELQTDYRIRGDDGASHFLHATTAGAKRGAGGAMTAAGWLEDVTESRRASHELAACSSVAEALDAWVSIDASGESLLAGLASLLDAEVAGLWVPHGGVLENRMTWSRHPDEFAAFTAATSRLHFPPGVGILGRAWRSRVPTASSGDFGMASPLGGGAAARADLHGTVALPAQTADSVVAVLDFHARDHVSLTKQLIRSLTGIGFEIGTFLARRRGEIDPPPLTSRELQVLQLAADGHSGQRIAERLAISPATVKTHFEHVYSKLGLSGRVAAVTEVLRLGVIH